MITSDMELGRAGGTYEHWIINDIEYRREREGVYDNDIWSSDIDTPPEPDYDAQWYKITPNDDMELEYIETYVENEAQSRYLENCRLGYVLDMHKEMVKDAMLEEQLSAKDPLHREIS